MASARREQARIPVTARGEGAAAALRHPAAWTALQNRKACLLGNHGMIALGEDLTDALAVAVEVESLCEQSWGAVQVGEPNILTDGEMQEVLRKFKCYGRKRQG